MGSLKASHKHRDHLPAIGFLGYRGPTTSPAPLLSPTAMYPNQPPPYPYSTDAGLGYISSPESRRAEDEKEKQATRQSLPSIHEALGNNDFLPYRPPPTTAAPQQTHSAPPPHHLSSNHGARSSGEGPSGSSNLFSNGGSFLREPTLSQQSQLQTETRSSLESLNTQDSRNASVRSLSSGKPPTQSASTDITSISGSQTGGHKYKGLAGSVASPTGYPGDSQPYSFQSQPPPGTPVYIATSYDSRPHAGPRVYNVRGGFSGQAFPGPSLGDSATHHLDVYDIEASLNEMVGLTSRIVDFTRHYANEAYQSRSGPVMSLLLSLQEIKDMLNIQRRNHDALMCIRTALLNKEYAMAEQMAQRKADKPCRIRGNDCMATHQKDRTSGSDFDGRDSEKRCSKAAPPGRCHSCNRAETPEWRRGPDGARTLCNACGLHYAKLTRKMGRQKIGSLGIQA
ncbi:hypothetical protein ASPWEDRAFT_46891 [Aspergillus wentii DTO 134E9]|uniref:GATA-type domain-containing protein n=1 Tax=Aspergillus wentii DTO 134E9 TaxID=1073089 RepID=A0A1L9R3Z9_ASPWE|nr:uncharacterized protein ASPWEDRAFT_46891 [Aspergillus wentii DTO 134E9]KAI9925372.1 hypothetical protein MW887_006300 [Aspergillus wentii]OJJ29602.1 hypothetical protein ASPWEDRAFT_46891 [Aspergillus wentii DTO 134E9]